MNPDKSTAPAATSTPPPVVRVSVVEDHDATREQLVHQLHSARGITCLSDYGSATAALEGILREQPDVVLMDINLPDLSGIECVRQLKDRLPRTQFIMLTVYEDDDLIFKSLQAGAVGYLLKGRPRAKERLLEAVRDATAGGSPLNSLIARRIVQYFHNQARNAAGEQLLSVREKEVLSLLAKGRLYKEIADQMGVNIETVRKHCYHLYRKLQVSSRTEAVVKYLGW